MGTIGWPYIETRSPAELMKIVREVGIAPETVQLYLPTDGVYTVVCVDKPLEEVTVAKAA